jgi:RNA-binding protein YlmH
MLVKTNDPDFLRDEGSQALINTNINAFNQYKLARAGRESVMNQEKRIKSLENDISQLKELINNIVSKNNG